MATDLTVQLEDRPGTLAELGEALGGAGVNVDGFCAVTGGARAEVHVLVEDAAAGRRALEGAGIQVAGEQEVLVVDAQDRPGELGRIARSVAGAGVNITLAYVAAGTKVVIGADDLEKARGAV
jgi:hypothetical protein